MKTKKSTQSVEVRIVPTPPTEQECVDSFLHFAFRRVDALQERLEHVLTTLVENHRNSGRRLQSELGYCTNLFEFAAERAALEAVIQFAWERGGNVKLVDLHQFALAALLRTGGGGSRSSSLATNLCDQMSSEAWVRIVRDIGYGS